MYLALSTALKGRVGLFDEDGGEPVTTVFWCEIPISERASNDDSVDADRPRHNPPARSEGTVSFDMSRLNDIVETPDSGIGQSVRAAGGASTREPPHPGLVRNLSIERRGKVSQRPPALKALTAGAAASDMQPPGMILSPLTPDGVSRFTFDAKLTTTARHVVFVDDEQVLRRVVGRMLSTLGFTYDLLEDGDELFATLQKCADAGKVVRAVLLDIFMERSNGVDICSELIAHKQFGSIPVFAATSNALPADLKRYSDAGFQSTVLVKPYRLADLRRVLGDVAAE